MANESFTFNDNKYLSSDGVEHNNQKLSDVLKNYLSNSYSNTLSLNQTPINMASVTITKTGLYMILGHVYCSIGIPNVYMLGRITQNNIEKASVAQTLINGIVTVYPFTIIQCNAGDVIRTTIHTYTGSGTGWCTSNLWAIQLG